MPDAFSSRGWGGPGSGGPNIQYPIGRGGFGGLGFGGAGGMGGGTGFGSRFAGLARRRPGLPPPTDPALGELGRGVGPGGEIYDPESLFNVRGHGAGQTVFNAGFYGGGEDTYDVQGRRTGTKKPTFQEGTLGYNSGPSMQQLRGYSSALGNWRGRSGPVGGVNQGAGFGSQQGDILRRLLEARMDGGGF